jgi:hypothetical protein
MVREVIAWTVPDSATEGIFYTRLLPICAIRHSTFPFGQIAYLPPHPLLAADTNLSPLRNQQFE